MVLAPGGVILFFGWWSLKEGLPLVDTRDVGFHLVNPVNWAGREAQVVQEGCWAIADTIKERRTRARTPLRNNKGKLEHTTSKSGCKTWRKMCLKWRWEMVMWVITGLSRGMLILNVWVEVEDGIEDNVPNDYWETLPVDFPLQGQGVPIKKVNRVPISQPWWGGLGRVTEQEGQKEVWGWRSICWFSRMKRPRMLWLTIPGGGT